MTLAKQLVERGYLNYYSLLLFQDAHLVASESLFAHSSHGTGFMAGYTHAVFGIDHLLAILRISIFGFALFLG